MAKREGGKKRNDVWQQIPGASTFYVDVKSNGTWFGCRNGIESKFNKREKHPRKCVYRFCVILLNPVCETCAMMMMMMMKSSSFSSACVSAFINVIIHRVYLCNFMFFFGSLREFDKMKSFDFNLHHVSVIKHPFNLFKFWTDWIDRIWYNCENRSIWTFKQVS